MQASSFIQCNMFVAVAMNTYLMEEQRPHWIQRKPMNMQLKAYSVLAEWAASSFPKHTHTNAAYGTGTLPGVQ